MTAVPTRPVPQRQPGSRSRRSCGSASPSARRGFSCTCWSSPACSSNGSTARSPASRTARRHTTSSRKLVNARLRHADHAWRAAPRPAVSRPVQAALRGHRRAEQPPPQGRLAGPVRRAVDAAGCGARPTGVTAGWAPSRTSGAYFREALDSDLPDDWYPHLTFGTGDREDDAILSRQAADRRAAQGRAAARVSLPGDARGADRLSGVPAAARRRCSSRSTNGRFVSSSRADSARPRRSIGTPSGRVPDAVDPETTSKSSTGTSGRGEARSCARHADRDLDVATAARKFGAARFEALHRVWQHHGDSRPLDDAELHPSRPAPTRAGTCRIRRTPASVLAAHPTRRRVPTRLRTPSTRGDNLATA